MSLVHQPLLQSSTTFPTSHLSLTLRPASIFALLPSAQVMRIATLQFNPALGSVQHNIVRANALLDTLRPGQIDILVLPELAFSGYNFPSLEAIRPFLEPTAAGPSTEWAVQTARRLQCYVTIGYPEIYTAQTASSVAAEPSTQNFNSTVTVSPTGEMVANYRKSFLYYTDETWASEGHQANPKLQSALQAPFFTGPWGTLGNVGHGICMDINPYRFITPFHTCEFANTMLENRIRLVVLSMAWLTHRMPEEIAAEPDTPDMETVAYWRERFIPFIEASRDSPEEILVVFANRCGVEGNRIGSVHVENGEEVEEGDRVCYAGSSCVMCFAGGAVRMYERASGEGVGILGKGEEGVLVVDTSLGAKYTLQQGPA